jgi:hypothetical protein
LQVFIEDGLVRLKNLIAEKITVQQLCVEDVCVDKTKLKALLDNAGINSQEGGSTSQTLEDTESPIITLNGPSAVEIEIGTNWSDPGAKVTDNVNDNLGIYYKVDGVLTPNEGRELPQIDTSVVGNHTITYTATDQAGNVGTAKRTVVVYNPIVGTGTTTPQ